MFQAIQNNVPGAIRQLDQKGIVPLDVHNVIDYVAGASLIAGPYLFGFSHVPRAKRVWMTMGMNTIGYSAMTRYRFSLAKIIPLAVHMGLDVISGAGLIGAPYLFGYNWRISRFQKVIHFVLGGGVIGLVALTRPKLGLSVSGRSWDTTSRDRRASSIANAA